MSSSEAEHGHAHPPTADVSVRPALAEDAEILGDVHARTLRATLAAGVGHDLGPEVVGAIDPGGLAESWSAAITSPPSPRHRVLAALDGARVVGFAAFAPAEVPVETRPAEAGEPAETQETREEEPGAAEGAVAEILALEVPAAESRKGHGSRLLAACADLLRQQGAQRLQAWVVQDDESRTRFFAQAGFAPAGVRRTLDVAGEDVTEICWYAEL
ncbi:hypothetical protein GCM10023169_19360 [Georgenia halophila]|uniref:N-acetyltransferase domain-containing protein n=1 Tax=Georgenia halophila TaxID=620889 RepID=A0ABP8L643_9MICO